MIRRALQVVADSSGYMEFAERMAIGVALLIVMLLQILLASKSLTDSEAAQLVNLIEIGNYAIGPWTIASGLVVFYIGMAALRWVAGFTLALDAKFNGDTA